MEHKQMTLTPEDLQQIAHTYKLRWSAFEQDRTLKINDITFTSGIGIYLNNVMAAVASQGHFVALKTIPKHIADQVRTEHEESEELDVELVLKNKDGKELKKQTKGKRSWKVADLSVITPDNLLEKGKPVNPLNVTGMWEDPICPNDE